MATVSHSFIYASSNASLTKMIVMNIDINDIEDTNDIDINDIDNIYTNSVCSNNKVNIIKIINNLILRYRHHTIYTDTI